jgi:hypothetical protein
VQESVVRNWEGGYTEIGGGWAFPYEFITNAVSSMAKQGNAALAGSTATSLQDLEQRFRELVIIWKRERGPYSSSARLAEHPSYQEIIRMGPVVVPLLLRELERQPDHWFRALHALTGADPVPAPCRGNIAEMADAWLRWGHKQGYQ